MFNRRLAADGTDGNSNRAVALWQSIVRLAILTAKSAAHLKANMATQSKYKRICLKLSGESFSPSGERGISMEEVVDIARQVKAASECGCQIAVVIGGGNILRGSRFTANNDSIKEATAHTMGMLATVINGLALQDALEAVGCETRLMSAVKMDGVCEPYIRRRALRHLEKDRIVILAAGTGGPFVTTDTAAALRSMELECEILMKATRVDGIYSEDPETNPDAELYTKLDFNTAIEKNLRVMDMAAISHCMENNIPIMVFNFRKDGNIVKAISGETVGTVVVNRGT